LFGRQREDDGNRPPHVGRRTFARMAAGLAVVAVLVGAAVSSAVILEAKHVIHQFNKHHQTIAVRKGFLQTTSPGEPQTILVLGSDHRYGQGKSSNSDTMMLLHLDADKGVTVLSIPRDLQVPIPGHGVDKINAAFAEGGAKLSVATVKQLMRTVDPTFGISHFVDVNFLGFQNIVNELHCVYADVDRHYFNDNNPPNGGGSDYATIDVQAGYQKLCGSDALDYVRYRHFDTDIVRAARQQQFLGEIRQQVGLGKLWSDQDRLLDLVGRTTQTDPISDDGILQIVTLAFQAAQHPVQQVTFPGDLGPSYVTVTPENLKRAVDQFEHAPVAAPHSITHAKKKKHKKTSSSTGPAANSGLVADQQGENVAIPLAVKAKIPVAYPTQLATPDSQYRAQDARAYTLEDRNGNVRQAYRIPIQFGDPGQGQVYGIQGLKWKNPPILQGANDVQRYNHRSYHLYWDGRKLRLVSWRAHGVTYWIANTLSRDLTNRQMLGIAKTVKTLS
jgi:LCP family protein required for cell wall assembly